MASGSLIVSLDFELEWGVRDKPNLGKYRSNLLGVREAIPAMLDLFSRYGIHATWATVGFLFFENKEELLNGIPPVLPEYQNGKLNPYPSLESIGEDESEDPLHFAPSLILRIADTPHQEIATHTFSHFYCLEEGQDAESFRADIGAAQGVAESLLSRSIRSLVFPRNQFNAEYLSVAHELGIEAYRGNPNSWIYRARNGNAETRLRRLFRLLDAYLPLSGNNCYPRGAMGRHPPFNIAASRFLRPVTRWTKVLDPLRLNRIRNEMTHAARNQQLFHLWWHPHNFGINLAENLEFLERILSHYSYLAGEYGFKSLNMGEFAPVAAK